MAAFFSNGRSPSWALMSPDGSYHKLREPSFSVGRHDDVDLTLKSRSVDKKHAVITVQQDQGLHYIRDLESLNGTFVNEKRVQKSKLGLGDTVRFGYDMNIFRVDLFPCQDHTLFDENNNNDSYAQDTNRTPPSHKCYKESNELSGYTHHHSEDAKSRLCHSCGSKASDNRERPETVIQGSTLYGQPSWWGWGSSDDEIYTYPNSATVISQSSTLPMPLHCTVLQQRIKRNKANLEQHYTSLKQPVITSTKNIETSHTQSPSTPLVSTPSYVDKFSAFYNLPAFGAWESVPHGSYVEGLEDDSLENESYHSRDSLSYHIPIVPDYGELPEKPVSEKSRRRTQNTIASDPNSSTSSVSENSDLDYDQSRRTPPSHQDHVFGLTEVTDPLGSNSPKGVRIGKPKHLPVKIKAADSKPSTPRSVTEKTRVRRNSSASSVTNESSSKASRSLTRAPSSGGSSVPSDNDSRGSGQTTLTSTSDDSDAEHNSPNDDKDDKRKTDKHKSTSPREREVYTGDVTDKGNRSSTAHCSPRVNKTALLRAMNSREAIKSSARRSSPLRSRATSKIRHRRSTPSSSVKDSLSSDSVSSSSLRIWSPSSKKPAKSSSPPENPRRLHSMESSVCSSVTSSSDGAQAVVDAMFEAGPPGSYVLPKELQMDRNDSSNKTFVLEDKNDRSSTSDAKTPDVSTNDRHWVSSVEDTLETLHLSLCSEGDNSKPLADLQADRPVSMPPQSVIGDWMTSLIDKGRSVSPESLVSVPPASSPSPPSTPRTTAKHLLQERLNCCSAPPHARRQWDITEKPVEDLMLSSVHAFTVELRLASELVLSKARNLYETTYAKDAEQFTGYPGAKQDNQSKLPEWKSSHAEIAGVFRNLRRVEFNLRTMDQALSYLCSTTGKDCRDGHQTSLPDRLGPSSPRKWNDFKTRARRFSWAEENRSKFPGPPSDDEEVTSPQ